jgi:Family of unknown function (DUF6111)
MLRVVLTIALPLLLPTGLYMLWILALRPQEERGAPGWAGLPWAWLAGAGALLLAVVLLVVTVGFGTAQRGAYVPPRYRNGHIIPGHIEPGPSR